MPLRVFNQMFHAFAAQGRNRLFPVILGLLGMGLLGMVLVATDTAQTVMRQVNESQETVRVRDGNVGQQKWVQSQWSAPAPNPDPVLPTFTPVAFTAWPSWMAADYAIYIGETLLTCLLDRHRSLAHLARAPPSFYHRML